MLRTEGSIMFGGVGNCTVPNQIFVKASHPQYKELYSTVLATFMAGKNLRIVTFYLVEIV